MKAEYKLKKSGERGAADYGWLKARHTFSFGEYYDPLNKHFRTMRVLNEDRISPGKGFPMHPHDNMEIVTYVISGSLKHEDDMGNSSVILPGDAQRMSAGTGVVHSEYNPSEGEETHLFQIWIFPNKKSLKPGYEQRRIPADNKLNRLCLIASENPEDYAVKIHQDTNIYASILEPGKCLQHQPGVRTYVWVQLASGRIRIDGHIMEEGDGLAINSVSEICITAEEKSEFLFFEFS